MPVVKAVLNGHVLATSAHKIDSVYLVEYLLHLKVAKDKEPYPGMPVLNIVHNGHVIVTSAHKIDSVYLVE